MIIKCDVSECLNNNDGECKLKKIIISDMESGGYHIECRCYVTELFRNKKGCEE